MFVSHTLTDLVFQLRQTVGEFGGGVCTLTLAPGTPVLVRLNLGHAEYEGRFQPRADAAAFEALQWAGRFPYPLGGAGSPRSA